VIDTKRDRNSRDRILMHIRYKNANVASGKTLCDKWVLDQSVRQYLGKLVTVDSYKLYKVMKAAGISEDEHRLLCTPQVFSIHINGADRLDVPNLYYNKELPAVSPYCPPIRYWDFCEGCWNHHYRTLKELAETDL